MKKRIASLLLCLCLVLALVPAVSLPAAASTNGHTQAEAVAWTNSQVGKYLDYDGAYGAQCVDLIKYYYAYLGNAKYGKGNATEYQSNAIPSGWTRVKSNPQPGDVIVWGGGTKGSAGWTVHTLGHVGIVVAVNGNKLTTVEQNINGSPCKKVNREASYATCFIRPDFTSNHVLTINFNVNGGKLNSAEFKATAAGIVQKDGKDVTTKWAYGTGGEQYGLWNASSFGLTRDGYTFIGWALSQDGSGTLFDQDDTSLKAENIYPKLKDGSASVTLYAVWQPADTAVYNISPKCAPNSSLDVEGNSPKNGANVHIWQHYDNLKSQQWAILPVGDGWYKLMPQHSPKALDVAGQGTTPGTNVQQYAYAEQHDAQKWKLEPAGDGYYYIIPKGNPDLCLDVDDSGSANGTNVKVWSRNGRDAQKWKLTLVSGTPIEFGPQSHDHDYSAEETKPTCTEEGFTTHTCKTCGDSYKDSTVPALGHEFKDGVCTRCGKTDGTAGTGTIILQIGNPEMIVNGESMAIDPEGSTPQLINNRTILPLGAVFKALGGTAGWDPDTGVITLKKDGKTLYLKFGGDFCWDDSGKVIPLDVAPIVQNNRTLLPLGAVLEYFGNSVEWEGASMTITIQF